MNMKAKINLIGLCEDNLHSVSYTIIVMHLKMIYFIFYFDIKLHLKISKLDILFCFGYDSSTGYNSELWLFYKIK